MNCNFLIKAEDGICVSVTVGEKERIVIKASYSKRFNKVATESHEETSTDEEDDEDETESSDYSGEGNDSDLVDSSKYKKISDEEIQRIVQEYRTTSFKNLQRRFHLSYQTLRNILIENGVELTDVKPCPICKRMLYFAKIKSIITNSEEMRFNNESYH